jgi:DNA gyrase/topoisomerase IV subunit B
VENLVEDLNSDQTTLHEPISGGDEWMFQQTGRRGWKVAVDFALQYTNSMETIERSYVNTMHTPVGGTHRTGMWSAIYALINEYAVEVGEKPFTQQEIAAGLTITVSIKHASPAFENQSRMRLINLEVYGIAAGIVYEHLLREPREIYEIILNKCRANREALRKV